MLTKGVILLHKWPHTVTCTKTLLKQFNWEIFFLHLIPDLALCIYHLFSKVKVWLTTQCFNEIMDGVNWLDTLAVHFFDEGVQRLVPH